MQLVLLRPKPRPLRHDRLLSLMHMGWEATTEEGRNKVGSVTVHDGDWDRIVPALGSFLKGDDVLGWKLWGAVVARSGLLARGRLIFRDHEGYHRATGWWGEEPPLSLEPPRPVLPTVPPPLLVVTLARKPQATMRS